MFGSANLIGAGLDRANAGVMTAPRQSGGLRSRVFCLQSPPLLGILCLLPTPWQRVVARLTVSYLPDRRDMLLPCDKDGREKGKRPWPTSLPRMKRKVVLLIVTLNRPERMNALHPPAHFELHEIWNDFESDPDVWIGVLTGAGEKAFSAGNDLKYTAEHGMGMVRSADSGFGGIANRTTCWKPHHRCGERLCPGGRLRNGPGLRYHHCRRPCPSGFARAARRLDGRCWWGAPPAAHDAAQDCHGLHAHGASYDGARGASLGHRQRSRATGGVDAHGRQVGQ